MSTTQSSTVTIFIMPLALACAATLTIGCSSTSEKKAAKVERKILDRYTVVNAGAINNSTDIDDAGSNAPALESADVGAPLIGDGRIIEPGDEIIADSLVGQINGRPIFANQFFGPIDAKLRALREQMPTIQFEQRLDQEIAFRLRDIVQSELLLSQAESRLSGEQQQGLFAWLEEQRKLVESRGGGERESAEANLRQQYGEGVTIEDVVDDRKNRALVSMMYEQEIAPRVSVSWRDIEREYEASYDLYNPPGRARIARIWLDTERQADVIAMVERELASGSAFEEIMNEVGSAASSEWHDVPAGGFGEIPDFIDLYQEQLATLSIGETSEPFEHTLRSGSKRLVWLHIAEEERKPGRSIYDPEVQLELRQKIEAEQRAIETDRYFREQLAEGISADIASVGLRLAEIGRSRYTRK